jgi:hypothetical protein
MELQEGATAHWEPVGRLATDRPCGDPELMTYRHFLDTFLLPYDDSSDSPEAQLHNNQVKARRQELKRAFTDDGQPGEMFCGVHRQLCRKLALPIEEATGVGCFSVSPCYTHTQTCSCLRTRMLTHSPSLS